MLVSCQFHIAYKNKQQIFILQAFYCEYANKYVENRYTIYSFVLKHC